MQLGKHMTDSQIKSEKKKRKIQAHYGTNAMTKERNRKPEGHPSHQNEPTTTSQCNLAGNVYPVSGNKNQKERT